ncbi:DUF1941 family protein [Schizosaccharomyces japonicus yFS275]|uniref:DUF1941 family protein n=1 Tax=Schizosaccharomyces japonicus (strain yFS275 / FY16936) TaxID=402676 RepID=B6K0J4_SCHJY|nr:DUF1941 family protein [Schizosaccharomyces japonicus yFS275]EEB07465.1 DUF1941 family protein [Schizosaccharomyces japonicus yFS275]
MRIHRTLESEEVNTFMNSEGDREIPKGEDSVSTTSSTMSNDTRLVLNNCCQLLHSEDDTSKLVALSMLAKVLNENPEVLSICWERMDMHFLDRLLVSKREEYVDVGVSVLLAFCSDERILNSQEMAQRIPAVMKCSKRYWDYSVSLLCAFCYAKPLSKVVLRYADVILSHDSLESALEVLSTALYNQDTVVPYLPTVVSKITATNAWSSGFVLHFFTELFSRFPVHCWYSDSLKSSLKPLVEVVMKHFVTKDDLVSTCIITSALLKAFGVKAIIHDLKMLLLVTGRCTSEIRSCLSLLVACPRKSEQKAVPLAICSSFGVISILLNYLCEYGDEISGEAEPEVFFKLQKHLSEMFFDTMEFMREFWDNNEQRRIQISSNVSLVNAMSTLCFWLAEDDSQLEQAAGLMDIFLSLWQFGWQNRVDYPKWFGVIMPSLLGTKIGWHIFESMQGWKVVWKDFCLCNQEAAKQGGFQPTQLQDQEAYVKLLNEDLYMQACQDFNILIQVRKLIPPYIWEDPIWRLSPWKEKIAEDLH